MLKFFNKRKNISSDQKDLTQIYIIFKVIGIIEVKMLIQFKKSWRWMFEI